MTDTLRDRFTQTPQVIYSAKPIGEGLWIVIDHDDVPLCHPNGQWIIFNTDNAAVDMIRILNGETL